MFKKDENNEKEDDKKIIGLIIFIIVSFIALLVYYFSVNNNVNNKNNVVNKNKTVISNNSNSKKDNISFDEYYYPQYKDNNNICGIAQNINTNEKVAISSNNEVCPTEDVLERNGYKYIITIDNYRPELLSDGSCGYTHLVNDSSLLSDNDISKLQNKLGDLNNLSVSTDNNKCPTVTELSDVIKSPIGIILHFMYNEINLNKNNYSVISLDNDNAITSVNRINEEYVTLDKDYANVDKYHDMHDEKIPMVYINEESKQLCKNNMSDCHYDSDGFYLVNKDTYEEYHLKSHNGYNIPRDMVTKKSYDLCQGDYLQCDLNSNEDNEPILVNISTNEVYIQPDKISVEQQQ